MSTDDDDLIRGNPSRLQHVQKHVMTQACTNQALRQCLQEGSEMLGTYHAQLGVDRLRQLDELASLERELEQLKKEEEHLEGRIDFLFHDCRRLEADNAVIMSGFAARDASTNDVKRLLRLEGEKFADVTKKTAEVQSDVLATSKKLVELKSELRFTKRLRTDKRNASWDTQDDLDRMEEVIALAKEEMEHLRHRVEAAQSAHEARVAAESDRLSRQRDGGQRRGTVISPLADEVGARPGTMGTSMSGGSVIRMGTSTTTPTHQGRPSVVHPPSQQGSRHLPSPTTAPLCKRPDCVSVSLKLAELLHPKD